MRFLHSTTSLTSFHFAFSSLIVFSISIFVYIFFQPVLLRSVQFSITRNSTSEKVDCKMFNKRSHLSTYLSPSQRAGAFRASFNSFATFLLEVRKRLRFLGRFPAVARSFSASCSKPAISPDELLGPRVIIINRIAGHVARNSKNSGARDRRKLN